MKQSFTIKQKCSSQVMTEGKHRNHGSQKKILRLAS